MTVLFGIRKMVKNKFGFFKFMLDSFVVVQLCSLHVLYYTR